MATTIVLAGTIMLISGGVASGGSAIALKTAIDNCQNPDIPPQSRIEACSELIHSNLVAHRFLARFYFLRAVAYEDAQDFDHALQDYNQAIELDPNFPEAAANSSRLKQEHPEAVHADSK